MTGIAWLALAFFASGAAALAFENVWFRQLGLVFGNGVWASSVVLAAFMGGLALGNVLAARVGPRVARPLAAYARLEALVAVTGAAMVLALPRLAGVFAAALAPFAEAGWAVNAFRLAAAFALLAVPATAMGMTLPVLVRALVLRDVGFGPALGLLYGWNTLGAVAGTLATEMWLIRALGVAGTGLFAAGLNLAAAAGALVLSRRAGEGGGGRGPAAEPPAPVPAVSAGRILAAACLAGGILLGLEVVWFRFLLLFAIGSSATFAVMLAVVLAGIGLGGLAGGAWLRADPAASRHAGAVAFLAGAACFATYAGFGRVLAALGLTYVFDVASVVPRAAFLMLAVSLASGVIFTLLASALRGEGARAAGRFTFANTAGALVGSLLAGFVLLPGLGAEASLFVLAAAYGIVALLGGVPRAPSAAAAAAVFLIALALFPWGLMRSHYLPVSVLKYAGPETRLAAVREGTTETIAYLEERERGEVEYHRLVTNGFSMSTTRHGAMRYMKQYVYLPVALHPAPRHALLISYGVGSTAKALTDTRELETIDVVDISRDVLEMSALVHPDPAAHPLRDPRVRVHVEDGRYFLQSTRRRFDLITAEPPPPKHAGVVNLYSAEYFALARGRLNPGGFVTYWLPVHGLEERDTRAILRAFCDAFPDCTLWSGTNLDWMLVGTNGARGPVDEARFRRQWDDAVVGPEIRRLGFESPEMLGATFMADADGLRGLIAGAEPLVDDRPQRLTPIRAVLPAPSYARLGDAASAREAFAGSAWVAGLWPEDLRRRTLDAFAWQRIRDGLFWGTLVPERRPTLDDLHRVLTASRLEALPVLLLGSTPDLQRIARAKAARGAGEPWVEGQLAVAALARRDFGAAAAHAARSDPAADADGALRYAYALCLAGRPDEARRFLDAGGRERLTPEAREFLGRRFAL